MHVTFQSTGATNIQGVNIFNEMNRFVRKKERGQGKNKRKWVIEMNEARQLYLSSSGRIDTIDAAINRCNYDYVSWKYWHSPKLHCDALCAVTAYDFYLECATETLAKEAFGITADDNFKVLDFHDFRYITAAKGASFVVVVLLYLFIVY